jgi:hypothetical protein
MRKIDFTCESSSSIDALVVGDVLAGDSGYSDALPGQLIDWRRFCVPTNGRCTVVIRRSQGDEL